MLPSLGDSVEQLGNSEGDLGINEGVVLIKGPRGSESRKYTLC